MTREEFCAKIEEAKAAFSHIGKIESCTRYGHGHINDTFLVVVEGGRQYILQRINHLAYPHPDEIMSNIVLVTEHIIKKLTLNGDDVERGTLHVIKTDDGADFFKDSINCYWRVFDFVANTKSMDVVQDAEDFYRCAKAFGRFQLMLSDFPADKLYEPVVGFHNTRMRFENFRKAVKADACDRVKEAKKEIDFVLAHEDLADVLLDATKAGKLPIRITHNDTKFNNILFDEKTMEPVCVIDLDTVMPGLSVNDFGDAIRFGASTAEEDEKDLSKVHFDISLFEAYVKGFLEECGEELNPGEADYLALGAMTMTFECGSRFLADFLMGDVYFHTQYREHNLVRSRTQFKLLSDMEESYEEMMKVIAKYKKR